MAQPCGFVGSWHLLSVGVVSLPCRRSRVRVPSSAPREAPANTGVSLSYERTRRTAWQQDGNGGAFRSPACVLAGNLVAVSVGAWKVVVPWPPRADDIRLRRGDRTTGDTPFPYSIAAFERTRRGGGFESHQPPRRRPVA